MPKTSNRKKVRQNGLHDGIHIPSYDRWSDPLVLHHKLSGDLPLPFWYDGHDHDENSLQRYHKLWSFGNSHMKAGTDKINSSSDTRQRKEENIARVSNLSKNNYEVALGEIFSPFGPLTLIYAAIGHETGWVEILATSIWSTGKMLRELLKNG